MPFIISVVDYVYEVVDGFIVSCYLSWHIYLCDSYLVVEYHCESSLV